MTRRVTLLAVVSVLLVSVSAGCSATFWEGFNEGFAAAGGGGGIFRRKRVLKFE